MTRSATGVVVIAAALAMLLTHGVVVVVGDSMRPALARGDIVVYRRTAAVPVGGVAVFGREDGGLVVHRVVAHEPRGALRTRGDANQVADIAAVTSDRVRGRAILRLPCGELADGLMQSVCYTSQSVSQ